MSATTENSAGTTAIRPFTIPVTPEAELEALRARVAATRWPDQELVTDHSQGPKLAVMQELARYWATEYDWRRCEAKLNALPHFTTEIDGLDIHFIHVRSEHENALPVIITHGWPGSIIELLAVIDPLTNPTAHGGSAADAFDVVIPSMPGYGYSAKPRQTGWGPDRIARAWTELMRRLGYTRFVAQGGDWGAIITDVMAVQAPPELAGMHTNMAGVVPAEISAALAQNVLGAGGPPPAGLSAAEQATYEQLNFFYTHGLGYGLEMITQPQALYGIADSPVGLASWMINHDASSYSDIAAAAAGHPVGNLTRDEVLDNVSFYWLTGTAISSARLYWENTYDFFGVHNVTIPAAVSVFPNEIYKAPRSWAERAYPGLIYYNEVDAGCHFAPGRSRRCSAASSARRSGHCANRVQADGAHRARHPPCPDRGPGIPARISRGDIVMNARWRAPAGLHTALARLPVEGELPSFSGATGWLNSPPLTPADLRGKVALVDFGTYTCINWLRQLPYARAWARKILWRRAGGDRCSHARVRVRARRG